MAVKWGQFKVTGPECSKDMVVTTKVKTAWDDPRIKLASDWVTFT